PWICRCLNRKAAFPIEGDRWWIHVAGPFSPWETGHRMIQRFSSLFLSWRRVSAVTAAALVVASHLHAGVQVKWTDTFGREGSANAADSSVKIVADLGGNAVLLGISQNGRTGKDWFVQKCD